MVLAYRLVAGIGYSGVTMSGAGTVPAGAAKAVFGLVGLWIWLMFIGVGRGSPSAPEAAQAGRNKPTSQASGVIVWCSRASSSLAHGADCGRRQVSRCLPSVHQGVV